MYVVCVCVEYTCDMHVLYVSDLYRCRFSFLLNFILKYIL